MLEFLGTDTIGARSVHFRRTIRADQEHRNLYCSFSGVWLRCPTRDMRDVRNISHVSTRLLHVVSRLGSPPRPMSLSGVSCVTYAGDSNIET